MLRDFGRRAGLTALTFLLAGGVYLSAPPAPRAAASDCGANSGNKCWENQECVTLIFYKICTTKYKYYPAKEPILEVG